jgi:predicted nicotinamide N-methyase
MLHSRLRPAPRRNPSTTSPTTAAPAPDFHDADGISDVEESPEDVFGAFLAHLFPDDAPSFHGDPGQYLLYSSPRYGELEIMIPSYPDQTGKKSEEVATGLDKKEGANQAEDGRQLFAHFLWSAGMVVAEGVENASCQATENDSAAQKEAREIWSVDGETVMELGAGKLLESHDITIQLTDIHDLGAALPSLICALANASLVVATDHPSSPALTGAIEFNVKQNLLKHQTSQQTAVSIQPHEWGILTDSFSQSHKGTFTRIIAADCYWMRSQHENLARTMQWFLAPGGRVWCVSGFHTGRAIVADFFETALENGFEIERIFERDLVSKDEKGGEIRREWVSLREGEGPGNRQRWCVIAVLKRRE